MNKHSYAERYVSYLKKWQERNIELRDKVGYETFFVMSCIVANRNVPLVEWAYVKDYLNRIELKDKRK